MEKLFTNKEVQKLLQDLTDTNLEKIFAERVFDVQERSHFALMTEKMYEEVGYIWMNSESFILDPYRNFKGREFIVLVN